MRFFRVSCHEEIIVRLNPKTLPVAHSVSQAIRLREIFIRDPRFSKIAIRKSETEPRSRKIWIQFDGALEIGNLSRDVLSLESLRIRFQGFKRRGRRLFERLVISLDSRKRFPQLLADLGPELTQSAQHVVLVVNLRLYTRDQIASRAIHSVQDQVVVSPDLCNRAGEHRCTGRALADLSCHLPCELLVRLASHHSKCLSDLLVRKYV